ncbi:MAG: hypothetical protein JJ992_19880, partial [Planctomycetes bacterium]|nr:hypothetical protein [Planctomycetota bacterium]
MGTTDDTPAAVLVQPDGKIVVGGMLRATPSDDSDFLLVRYNADGSLDSSFGAGGRVLTDIAGSNDGLTALAWTPDGKILAVGWAYTTKGLKDFGLARYNSNGALDVSFGKGGKVTANLMGGYPEVYDSPASVAVYADGRILVGGQTMGRNMKAPHYYSFTALTRFTANGSLDTTFGNKGKVIGSSTGSSGWTDLHIDAQGIIVAVGGDAGQDVAAQFNNEGTLIFRTVLVNGADEVAFQNDDKFVAVKSVDTETTSTDILLTRNNSDGTLDESFGANSTGAVLIQLDTFDAFGNVVTRSKDVANDIALDSQGRIVVIG